MDRDSSSLPSSSPTSHQTPVLASFLPEQLVTNSTPTQVDSQPHHSTLATPLIRDNQAEVKEREGDVPLSIISSSSKPPPLSLSSFSRSINTRSRSLTEEDSSGLTSPSGDEGEDESDSSYFDRISIGSTSGTQSSVETAPSSPATAFTVVEPRGTGSGAVIDLTSILATPHISYMSDLTLPSQMKEEGEPRAGLRSGVERHAGVEAQGEECKDGEDLGMRTLKAGLSIMDLENQRSLGAGANRGGIQHLPSGTSTKPSPPIPRNSASEEQTTSEPASESIGRSSIPPMLTSTSSPPTLSNIATNLAPIPPSLFPILDRSPASMKSESTELPRPELPKPQMSVDNLSPSARAPAFLTSFSEPMLEKSHPSLLVSPPVTVSIDPSINARSEASGSTASLATTAVLPLPPPLYPRASAPSTTTLTKQFEVSSNVPVAGQTRRPLPGVGNGLRAGVRGTSSPGIGNGGPGGMKMPPSLQAKLAAMASRSSSSSSVHSTASSISNASNTSNASNASSTWSTVNGSLTPSGGDATPPAGSIVSDSNHNKSSSSRYSKLTTSSSNSSSTTPTNTTPSLTIRPPPPPPVGAFVPVIPKLVGRPPAIALRPGVAGIGGSSSSTASMGPVTGVGGKGSGGMAGRRRMGPGLTLSAMAASAGAANRSDSRAGSFASSGESGSVSGSGGPIEPNAFSTSSSFSNSNLTHSSTSNPSRNSMGSSERSGGRGLVGSPTGSGKNDASTPFSNFSRIVDPSGRLNFASKAVVHADGVDFSSGASFKIKMDDLELYEELGQGAYGTVKKVWHKPTKVTMALKEIRLELDDSKLKTIITELDILHRATSPFIIDFYGAFFIESCVYYCMEYMDAGSLETFAGIDVPEDVLSRVTRSMVEGLKFLKDELKIMHRDVKPTNVLLNRKGFVKLCDFGVSGQLDRSLAKTNIGCQSYMAPERIKGESQGATSSYTASSDVWSLGLSVIEFAIGHYPYPPETYSNVFAQLTAIVHGDPPVLPTTYSETAQDFVMACLEKNAARRPSYQALLNHRFLKPREVDMIGWIGTSLEYRKEHPRISTPALA